jgi:SAM-dependent methyltransferase
MTDPLIVDELPLLESLVPLARARIVEVGCGAARLARSLVERHPSAEVDGIDVDARQLARNLTEPLDRLRFERAGAEAMPFIDARFDGALMLKSLHHVPVDLMDRALSEVARVLVPHGWLYVSEPVYDGALNEIIRLFNDEGRVRAAAQAALDRAVAAGEWVEVTQRRFDMPVRFPSFEAFEQQAMRPSFADHGIDDAMVERVRERFSPHLGPGGASFTRPMHVRLLRRAR